MRVERSLHIAVSDRWTYQATVYLYKGRKTQQLLKRQFGKDEEMFCRNYAGLIYVDPLEMEKWNRCQLIIMVRRAERWERHKP